MTPASAAANRLPASILRDYGRIWKPLAVVYLVYSALAAIVLLPLLGGSLRTALHLVGKDVLNDLEIAFFLLRPSGLAILVAVGALAIAVVVFELAALLVIAFGASHNRSVSAQTALLVAARNTPGILRVAAEIIVRSLLVVAPFLTVIGVLYVTLLGDADINFYLSEKPPRFLVACGIAGVLVLGMAALLLRMLAGWIFALPLLLCDRVPAREALRESSALSAGRRPRIVRALLGWWLAASFLSAVVSVIAGSAGRLLMPRAAGSLELLVGVLGTLVLVIGFLNLAVACINISLLAVLIVRLHRQTGRGQEFDDARIAAIDAEPRLASWRPSLRTLVWGSLALLVAGVFAGALLLDGIELDDRAVIIAHRGGAIGAPENSLAAIRRAIDAGAEWIEIDVQETADDEILVIHDSDFKRVAGVATKAWDVTMADIPSIDIGSAIGEEFREERPPTLKQVLDVCHDRIGVNIELKYYGRDRRLEEHVIEIVEAAGMADQIVVMSLKREGVEKVRRLRPTWKVGLLTSVSVGGILRLDVDFLAVNAQSASPSFVRSAHRAKKDVYAWTVNDPVGVSLVLSRGVDGVITDDPAMAMAVLRQRAELDSIDRLLLELAPLFGIKPKIAEQ